ncbi:hypothetical protein HAX54_048728 [Datura stramonium]|uniref:Uncharacterized protein n=1 Tax=Datura stramonium TaxID=4076 RepID=A0ABS8SUZ2_DATST|nr:hypothetical protein [Datura stramonium]
MSSTTNHIEYLEAGELVKIQLISGEGPNSQDKSCNQADENRGSDLKSYGQQLEAHMNSLKNDSQRDEETHGMDHLLKEGLNDDEALDPTTPIGQQGKNPPHPKVSNWKHRESHPLDNIISFFDQGITTRSQVYSEDWKFDVSNLALYYHKYACMVRDHVVRTHTRQKFIAPWELTRDQVPQIGGLKESKEGTSNILQSEAKIIEGFITALGTLEKKVGERSPFAEGSRLDSSDGTCPFVQESGESSSQEAPPIAASPKWDGTPTLVGRGSP